MNGKINQTLREEGEYGDYLFQLRMQITPNKIRPIILLKRLKNIADKSLN